MRYTIRILYWTGAVATITLLLTGLSFSVAEAFPLAVMFLPGMVGACHLLPQISFKEQRRGIYHLTLLAGALLATEYLALMLTYIYTQICAVDPEFVDIPPLLVNPLFILVVSSAFVYPALQIERRMTARLPREEQVSFTSQRRRVTLRIADIRYIESLDDEVVIHTAGGERYRTRTRISQWEARLDDRFLRIHRAYLVNRAAITRSSATTVWIGETEIEISRKYRPAVRERLAPEETTA